MEGCYSRAHKTASASGNWRRAETLRYAFQCQIALITVLACSTGPLTSSAQVSEVFFIEQVGLDNFPRNRTTTFKQFRKGHSTTICGHRGRAVAAGAL